MRKNSVRKFIHAILDLLPLFVIPIFAIYSMNHEISGNSVNTSGYEVRNKYETNEVNTWDNVTINKIYHYDLLTIHSNIQLQDEEFNMYIYHYDTLEVLSDDEYIEDINTYNEYNANENNVLTFYFNNNDFSNLQFTNLNSYITNYYEGQVSITLTNIDFVFKNNNELNNFKVIVGDYLPSPSNFEILEYVYNEGIVLDDEDIMSQFVYVTYNAVDKYFNMGNVFNLTGVYDWFVVNIFGGNAPISLFIVWNIVLYEFVMDLLMLLYGLFMWFIEMIEKLMNKPLDSIK